MNERNKMNEHNKETKPYARTKTSDRLFLWQLVWQCLMGVTLGIICAGLLLQMAGSDKLIAGADTFVARLQFILEVAFLFGLGSTVTGITFLLNENPKRRRGDR